MAAVVDKKAKTVFGLDIGTRSIVGTVGYLAAGKFHVIAQRSLEHETRAMLEGQIHDIGKVGESILKVRRMLEQDLGKKLSDVCIAAAGRVLRTVTTHVEIRYEGERNITADDMYELSMMGVQKAYEEFTSGKESDIRFYCVGYTVMRYFVNGYQMTNPNGHKAGTMAADLIATFLPDDVVDGLYKAVEIAGLRVANLTLEPIAAIQVAIPDKFRLLNLALVDVGAGTSDICITKEGTIVAYGMIPIAGDSLTDCLAQKYLVDFDTAEFIKRSLSEHEEITFHDIMGLPQTVRASEILEVLEPTVSDMTQKVADQIRQLNGDKPVSAVFVVGGGGIIPGYTESLAGKLDIPKERVAVRGKEVMQDIVFEMEDARQDSMMVTPIGICYSYYEQSNNFIFVDFNGNRIKIYDNGKLTVADAAIQAQFPNEDLFPKRGDALKYTVNDRKGVSRGSLGEACEITLNGHPADLYAQIRNNDRIQVKPSSKGDKAVLELGKLPEMKGDVRIVVNGMEITLPRLGEVNGTIQTVYYKIKNGDDIRIRNWYSIQDISTYLDTPLGGRILVNDMPANADTRVYDSFHVSWQPGEPLEERKGFTADYVYSEGASEAEDRYGAEDDLENHVSETTDDHVNPDASEHETGHESVSRYRNGTAFETEPSKRANSFGSAGEVASAADEKEPTDASEDAMPPKPSVPCFVGVIANGRPVTLHGKPSYVYVDIFDYIDFDLKSPKGRNIVTRLNGRKAEYMEQLKDGDVIDIHWE